MKVGIPLEIHTNENRVTATPDSIKNIIKLGFEVVVESQAGIKSYFTDQSYKEAGAKIVDNVEEVFASDVVLKVNPPEYNQKLAKNESDLLQKGSTLICFVWRAQNKELLKRLIDVNINVLAMDCVPRLSRSQSLDALSSMANITGYKAIIEASNHFDVF